MRSLRRFIRLASAGVIMGGLVSVPINTCSALSGSATTPSGSAPDAQANFSRGVRDVLKMLDAKVDPEVIKAYIKNSNIAFNPTASEIIALKQRDVPDDMITAMIERGAAVRMELAQAAQAVQAPQAAPPVAAPSTPPAYDYGTSTPYYPYDYADYGYPYYSGYPYAYGYPYSYWGYNYSYPWAFYSPFFFGFHGFHDFDHFHHFGGFHGDHSFAFRGGNHFGPWSPTVGAGFHSSFAHGGFASHAGGFGGRMGGFGGHAGGGHGGHR